jgi:uncharacterized protein (DUF1697 family)
MRTEQLILISMDKYLVLFRGVNVGGKNKVVMAQLREYLKELGYKNVSTYINSGNAIIESDKKLPEITKKIEMTLPKKFKLDSELIKIFVFTPADIQEVIKKAPPKFGEEPNLYHTDIIFYNGISEKEALSVFKPNPDVDKIWTGPNVVYSQRLSAKRIKSSLSKIVGTTEYKQMTIRTWNTVNKLHNLMSD